MSKIKLLTIAVVVLFVLNIGILAFLYMQKPSHAPPGRPGSRGEGPKKIIAERLHFDKDQIAEYEKLISTHRAAVGTLEKDIRQTKNRLYATLIKDNQAGKDSLEKRLGEVQGQMEAVHYNHFVSIKALCKPEQQRYFNELTTELARFFAPGKNSPPPPKD
jgi:protein CpxP